MARLDTHPQGRTTNIFRDYWAFSVDTKDFP